MSKTVRLVFLGCLMAVAMVMCSMAIGQILAEGGATVSNLSEIQEADEYLVKSYGGYIAVYYDSEGYPVWIGDMPVSSLREYDRGMLDKGIIASDRNQLLQILEDLES